MSETTAINLTDEDVTALKVTVGHLLERVMTSPDFRWHMMGTESLRLLFEARAVLTGRDAESVRSEIEGNVADMPYSSIGQPKICELDAQLDAIRRWLWPEGCPRRNADADDLQQLREIVG